ncbi:hypothetical protein ACMBCM_03355 [Spiroplasma sp. K1]
MTEVLKTTKSALGSSRCEWIYFKNWTLWPEMVRMKRENSLWLHKEKTTVDY